MMLVSHDLVGLIRFGIRRYVSRRCYAANSSSEPGKDEEEAAESEFGESRRAKILQEQASLLRGSQAGSEGRRRGLRMPLLPPRARRMPTDQKWSDVWPSPATFKASAVPFPVRQGWVKVGETPPEAYANLELMKIPNFLHLSPPAVEIHCQALRKFCSPFPSSLEDEELSEKLFPVTVTTSDYCHSATSIRNPLSRIVTLSLPTSSLKLNERALAKLKRLVGERFDSSAGVITLVADRCPLKGQNLDHALYLLTAVVQESRRRHKWEGADENWKYVWEATASARSTMEVVVNVARLGRAGISDLPAYSSGINADRLAKHEALDKEEMVGTDEMMTNKLREEVEIVMDTVEEIVAVKDAVTNINIQSENSETLCAYKRAILSLMGLQLPPTSN